MLVADLYLRAEGRRRFADRNPVDVFHFKCGGAQRIVFADYDAILFVIDATKHRWACRRRIPGLCAGRWCNCARRCGGR